MKCKGVHSYYLPNDVTIKYDAHSDDPPLSHRHAYYCNDLFLFKNRQKQLHLIRLMSCYINIESARNKITKRRQQKRRICVYMHLQCSQLYLANQNKALLIMFCLKRSPFNFYNGNYHTTLVEKKGFHLEMLGALAPVVLRIQTKD
jgi:hypothetical protein